MDSRLLLTTDHQAPNHPSNGRKKRTRSDIQHNDPAPKPKKNKTNFSRKTPNDDLPREVALFLCRFSPPLQTQYKYFYKKYHRKNSYNCSITKIALEDSIPLINCFTSMKQENQSNRIYCAGLQLKNLSKPFTEFLGLQSTSISSLRIRVQNFLQSNNNQQVEAARQFYNASALNFFAQANSIHNDPPFTQLPSFSLPPLPSVTVNADANLAPQSLSSITTLPTPIPRLTVKKPKPTYSIADILTNSAHLGLEQNSEDTDFLSTHEFYHRFGFFSRFNPPPKKLTATLLDPSEKEKSLFPLVNY